MTCFLRNDLGQFWLWLWAGLLRMAALIGGAKSRRGGFPVMMLCRRWKENCHPAFGGAGVLGIRRVEHGDYGGGADPIAPRPLAVDQSALHGVPMLVSRRLDTDRLGDVDIVGIAVDRGEKVDELLEIHPHLVHKLA